MARPSPTETATTAGVGALRALRVVATLSVLFMKRSWSMTGSAPEPNERLTAPLLVPM